MTKCCEQKLTTVHNSEERPRDPSLSCPLTTAKEFSLESNRAHEDGLLQVHKSIGAGAVAEQEQCLAQRQNGSVSVLVRRS